MKLDERQVELFRIYAEELQEWNQKINLVSAATIDQIVPVHFLDSLSCIKSGRFKAKAKVADVGAGAGFPGIPLRIASPAISLTLVDASRKKVDFLEALLEKLALSQVQVVWQRAEEFARISSNRGSYDIVVTRAVAALAVLLEYSLPLLKLGGAVVAQKGRPEAGELDEGRAAASILGGKIVPPLTVHVPYLEGDRNLIIVEKTANTPEKYPRRAGVPEKRPLGQT